MSILSLNVVPQTGMRKSGEIDHHEIFSAQMAELCMSEEFSDVSFEIQNEKIPGHVMILVTRSKYFRALLFGGVVESKQNLFQLKVPIEAFKALLKYIYSGYLSLSQMCEKNILETLSLVNQCGCTELELSIAEYLSEILSLDNVCVILDSARVLGLETLQNNCHIFIDVNATDVLLHESFKNLTEETLKNIISRDTLFAPEFQIFHAVNEWCKYNSNVVTESVVSLIRLPLLSLDHLLEIVRYSGVFGPNSLLDAIQQKTASTSLAYRKGTMLEKNIATEKFGSRVTVGKGGSALLDDDTTSFDLHEVYARHMITDDLNLGIIVELGLVTLINHIKLRLVDHALRSYSYFVDVSVDKTNWERVVDYRSYHCRSWQFLYFKSRPVRYIKLVGTHCSTNQMFEVVSLAAYYTAKVPKMSDGIIAPTKNVATCQMGATFVPDKISYPKYFPNEISDQSLIIKGLIIKGSIIIQLGQPYVIGSMYLNLCGARNYSFHIETSINQKNWEVVVDDQREALYPWQQHFRFEPRVITFIKIVGTNTILKHNRFGILDFRCSSPILDATDDNQEESSILDATDDNQEESRILDATDDNQEESPILDATDDKQEDINKVFEELRNIEICDNDKQEESPILNATGYGRLRFADKYYFGF